MIYKSDCLVIGSGVAGLSFSLNIGGACSINIVSKKEISESNTKYAQGGIAVVQKKEDDFEYHIQDTLEAGDGLCDESIVRMVIENGPKRIKSLIDWGVQFSLWEKDKSQFDLAKEGGHSKRRIMHYADFTGEEIENKLINQVKKHNNIKIFEHHIGVNLIIKDGRCWGAYVLDKKKGIVKTFLARFTILATGGAGKVYIYTSNPDTATGDGIAMAYRAGAKVANMEFVQFHPTCLYHPYAKSFLISEAVRGEGGILRLDNGKPFMKSYHPMGELAPRDIVAKAIDFEIKKSGADCVYLDITHREPSFIKRRFPNIYKKCLSFGIDITKDLIPVVPAAHYTCGGVFTDASGRTNIKALYAIGEVACTGLHGANRLASNSILEAIVFSYRTAEKIKDNLKNIQRIKFPKIKPWYIGKATDSDESVVVSHNWDEVRRLMWNYVGIVRSNKRLARAKTRIKILKKEVHQYYWDFIITADLIELRNIITVSELIIESAIKRKESRGLHYTIDHPKKNDKIGKRLTVLKIRR